MAPTGKPGSVLMFHGNLVHASPPNITPFPRKIVYLTLCAVSTTTSASSPGPSGSRIATSRRSSRVADDCAAASYARAHRVAAESRSRREPDAQAAARAAAGRPVRVGLIGAGKFGSMFLAQVPTIPGLEVAVIADLDPERAREACRARRLGRGADRADTAFTDCGPSACARRRRRGGGRGDRQARRPGSRTRSPAIDAGKHIVMVNVEADVLAGPLLAAKAARARRRLLDGLRRPAGADRRDGRLGARGGLRGGGGRQGHQVPARATTTSRRTTSGRTTASPPEEASGRGHEPADVQLLPRRHQVGDRDGGDRQRLRARRAGATGWLSRPAGSTTWPTCCGRAGGGGQLEHEGMVEVVSSLERDGRPVFRDLRWGVYVVIEGAERLRRRLLQAVRPAHRRHRPLRRHVQAVPPDRARALDLGAQRRPARRADRCRRAPGAATSWRSPSAR